MVLISNLFFALVHALRSGIGGERVSCLGALFLVSGLRFVEESKAFAMRRTGELETREELVT
jgi:hypothetical protein